MNLGRPIIDANGSNFANHLLDDRVLRSTGSCKQRSAIRISLPETETFTMDRLTPRDSALPDYDNRPIFRAIGIKMLRALVQTDIVRSKGGSN
jgi:hypothetical protein